MSHLSLPAQATSRKSSFLSSKSCFLQGIFHQINFYMNSLIFSETGLQNINIPVILISFLSGKNLLEYRVNSVTLFCQWITFVFFWIRYNEIFTQISAMVCYSWRPANRLLRSRKTLMWFARMNILWRLFSPLPRAICHTLAGRIIKSRNANKNRKDKL